MRAQRHQAMKWVFIAFVILILNSGYLAAFAEPTLFYMLNVLLHIVLGVALIIPFFVFVRRFLAHEAPRGSELAVYMGRLGYWSLSPCVLTGLYLVVANATHAHRWVLYFHIAAGFIGAAFFQKSIRSVAHKISVKNSYDIAGRVAWVVFIIALLLPLSVGMYNFFLPRERTLITNSVLPPNSLKKPTEWGANSPFAPSAVSTPTQKYISAKPFLSSNSCGRTGCHLEVVQQWQSSAHRYSAFNNPWYRRSVTQLLENKFSADADTNNFLTPNHPAKWCAGCHAPALLVSGKSLQPLPALNKTSEAHSGVTCVACHSIVHVRSTAGQADYVIEETPLHEWAASENKILQVVYDFLLRADPEPHRRSMMKPFHRDDGAKFCSTCHKAHLDQPVNQFRWMRSFNDYDPWQTGPFSSGRNRGYIAAPEGKKCVDCHMPTVALKNGDKVRSHRFLGANTALPTINQDRAQLEATTAFLQDQQVSVEIFALGKPAHAFSAERRRHDSTNTQPETLPATLSALGDEHSFMIGAKPATVPLAQVIAPLAQNRAVVKPGEEIRLDVVVRSQSVGHFFPTGKVEMSEAWLELQAFDKQGRIIFWSGAAADDGKGPVDSNAHFYRSYLIDGSGQPLAKNNSWAARAVASINLLPPGGAEVVRYRLKIPAGGGDEIHVVAKLNYRKFSWAFTRWVFAEASPPEFPIVEMARHEVTLSVAADTALAAPKFDHETSLNERWSDYGWGLLTQNDCKNAEAAFLQVVQNVTRGVESAESAEKAKYGKLAEAWVNVGIVRLHEGNVTGAQEALATAMKTGAVPFKWYYYYGVTLKAQGNYTEALKHFKKVVSKFPRDRVAKLERGQLYLALQDYERARGDFEKVLGLDPENVEAYYYLQQVYQKLGEEKKAQQAAALYERYKASSSQISLNDTEAGAQNIQRERQAYHEHVSMPLPFTNSLAKPIIHDKVLAGKP